MMPEVEPKECADLTLETTLWERLGKAVAFDIESSEFLWDKLVSLHHTEHTSSTEHSEDEMNKPLEVTVNSGGLVFFALFRIHQARDGYSEGVAVIKFSSTRMATQAERLGYEFAKCFGVQTPQARVIHNSSAEWQSIKDAAENSRNMASAEGDEMGKTTCTEILEALELSRCLLLMGYVHGFPLLDTACAFNTQEAAQKTAKDLGRVLLLDLVLRNEDRLPCRQLGWRGNAANLLFTERLSFINVETSLQGIPESMPWRNRGAAVSHRERRFHSVDAALVSQSSDTSDWVGSAGDISAIVESVEVKNFISDFYVVAIDSGVPRRPPAGKRSSDQVQYPKIVELLLNSTEFSSNLLYEISGEKLGSQTPGEAAADTDACLIVNLDQVKVVHEFRAGFRAALREMQTLHVFLLKLHQKLEALLRIFMSIISKTLPGDEEKEDYGIAESYSASPFNSNYHSPIPDKEFMTADTGAETEDGGFHGSSGLHDLLGKQVSKSPFKDSSSETPSPGSRDNWHGKHSKGSGDAHRNMRLTLKLKDFNKIAKVDSEVNKELEVWSDSLRTEAIKFCQENGFNTGFFEGGDNNHVVDSYELKVRLEHLLERMALISQAADTERPSCVTNCLFIGGALAAKSINTLQYLGVTHILCLCPNEIGQSEAQYPELFEYKNFAIYDTDDANISSLFEDACNFIEGVERIGGKILVHCFEGKSRSATVVLAYLMLCKHQTLLEAWTQLKRVHRRAQPNDGFMRALLDLDVRLHGKASMDWQQRKPVMRTCPICGKGVGLSTSSLKLHLQKSHRRVSSGSVDSLDLKDLQQAIESVKTC
ncbi:dual specificity protein phosphatase PHS1 isoform X2 [Cryptomeria japonica]|uniref:dual specificity protein phosphatase PHS1 isoform X2 n=1 Tax=Cryptomeria japonica TaxID=3369 RepID=UPI0025ABFB8C|nr:dual specificity protein phosphatase PHS1 isoform X2 [Cryptomeria japonica]